MTDGRLNPSGRFFRDPDGIATILGALGDHIRPNKAEPGYGTFEVSPFADDPRRFDLDESFVHRAASEARQMRTLVGDWWAVTEHLRRDFRIPE